MTTSKSSLTEQPQAASFKVLVVEDDDTMRRLLETILKKRGHSVVECADARSARTAFQRESFPLVILDLNLPDIDGLELCRKIRSAANGKDTVILVVTSRDTHADLQAVLDAGADDYQTKPIDTKLFAVRLAIAERRALDKLALHRAAERITVLEEQTKSRGSFEGLVGRSDAMQEVFRRIRLAAESNVTTLVLGESGTGKELVARAVHSLSARKDKPFVAVNCQAIPETLLESELFGHVKGAFTGAIRDKTGLFQAADGGTLFLDEVAEMSHNLQVKLLRVLQEREIPRLGDSQPVKVDLRIICATNREPDRLLSSGAMREDFYFRIRVLEITIPPLRLRPGDVMPLVNHFISEFSATYRRSISGVDPDVFTSLMKYAWPGNVRELRNVIERAFVTATGDRITSRDLSPEIVPSSPARTSGHMPSEDAADPERQRIIAVLQECAGNQTAAARLLGFSRMTLWKKIRRHRISVPDTKTSPTHNPSTRA